MTTAAFDDIAPESAEAVAGEPHVFDHVCRLVPCSGLQFIDAKIDADDLPTLRAWFTEDDIESAAGVRRVLLPLSSDASADGTIWHPLTFQPLGPDQTLSFTGLEALEPFLDTWVPVPYLRYLGRSGTGSARFDQGPANWSRVFVSKPQSGLRGTDQLSLVFGFDTRLDIRSRADQSVYLAPNSDDALFASTFMLADAPEELSDFLGQPWIDTWVRDCCRNHANAGNLADLEQVGFVPVEPDVGAFTLAHVARYLTFLKILKRAATPPQIRFVDSISKSLPIVTTGIDLIIDFGASETTALLVPRSQHLPPDIGQAQQIATALRVRDLTNPVEIHMGPIPTVVEFDNQTFGQAALSRRSGRADAFAWTSLVRIGIEAQRLALRLNATDGITGHCDIAAALDQTEASPVLWRFSTPDAGGIKTSPMVTGETLRHISVTGEVTTRLGQLEGPSSGASAHAMRPRFSLSSLSAFFFVELLLHAISEINSATPGSPFAHTASARSDIRQIERVIVTSPLAMPALERTNLIERINAAIDLVWRTQAWDVQGVQLMPTKPQLSLGIGPDAGLQIVYLYDEVRNKFGGSFADFVDCVRRRSGDPDARDNVRISSMDLSQRTSGLTVIDYDVTHDGSIQAELVFADQAALGGERVIDALVETIILTAIEHSLTAHGVTYAHDFLQGFLAGSQETPGANPLGKRLTTKVLRPAARGLFNVYQQLPSRGAEGLRRFRLDHVIASSGGRLGAIAPAFEAAASAAGAKGFQLGLVTFDIGRRHIQRLIETALWPLVAAMADAVKNSDSDIMLMSGDLAELPDLLDHVLSRAPVTASRFIVCLRRIFPDANAGGSVGTQSRAVLGAYMASRNLLNADGFSLITREIAQSIANDNAQPVKRPLFSPARQSTDRAMTLVQTSVRESAGRERNLAAALLDDDAALPTAKTPAIERAR